MQCFISQKTLKKQTKTLMKTWDSPLKSLEARKILTELYGYDSPHHYSKTMSLEDGSSQLFSKDFLLHNLNYFINRFSIIGEISHDRSLYFLHLLWPDYIPEKGTYPHQANLLFHGILKDFLLKEQNNKPVKYNFNGHPSIKDSIEAIGVPHTEVGTIMVNKKSVDFSYQLQPNDEVVVYPMITPGIVRRFPLIPEGKIKFILDVHLGTLAKYLRMAGFDTAYESIDQGDALLSEMAANEERILFTRDIGLLKRSNVIYGYWIRNMDPLKQFEEIITRYDLAKEFNPFSRCISCNGETKPLEVSELKKRTDIPENVLKEYSDFKVCANCSKVYWKGSHYHKMDKFLRRFTQ